MHGDEAVAALESELVDPYLARPVNDCSLSDSDGTEISNSLSQLMIFKENCSIYYYNINKLFCHVVTCKVHNGIEITDYYFTSWKGIPKIT